MNIRRVLLIIVILSVLVRLLSLGWVVVFGPGEEVLVQDDSIQYVELGRNLATGLGFVEKDLDTGVLEPATSRPIGLPLLLAPFTLLPHSAVWWGIVMSLAAGILLPLLTYKIGEQLFNVEVAILAATFVAFEPHLIWFSWLPLTEVPFMIFALFALWLYFRNKNGDHPWREVFLAGVSAGAAILIRPQLLFLLAAILIAGASVTLFKRRFIVMQSMAIFALGMILVISPWSWRNAIMTGSPSISSSGWYNLYSDYLAGVRAIDNNTYFHVEKEQLLENAPQGLTRDELLDPENAPLLREITLTELANRKSTVVKMESAILFSFFTNDGYFYYLENLGFISAAPPESYPSVTFALLSQGGRAWGHAVEEIQRQYFIPLFGRAFTGSVLLLALAGLLLRRDSKTILISLVIFLWALLSTAVGLGVQARFRVPIEPLLFLLASLGAMELLNTRKLTPLHEYIMAHGFQFIRFCISGGTAALVGVVSTYLFTDVIGLYYVLSSFFAFVLASVTAFSLQKFWTFRDRGFERMHVQTAQTLVLALFNLLLNTFLIYLFVDIFHLYYLISQIVIYCIIGLLDYVIYKYVIFKK